VNSSGNIVDDGEGAAKALHLAFDPDLKLLIETWPKLSAESRRCIVAVACK
jgi:hypothetical protein